MAIRKGWDDLSAAYRKRLQRGGISRADYVAGRSLARARGHGGTPEHPTDKIDKGKYPKYYAERQRLINEFIAKKDRLWGELFSERRRNGSIGFSPNRSADNVRNGKMSNELLRWALSADESELIDALRGDPETFAFIGYH